MRLNNQPFLSRIAFLTFKTELMLAGAIGHSALRLHINQIQKKQRQVLDQSVSPGIIKARLAKPKPLRGPTVWDSESCPG